jgi:carbamoyl-phosphate synthase large subunit
VNVLITSASRKVSLIRAFQQAVADTGGGQVIAVDVSPLAAALYLADAHFLVPRSEDETFLPSLVDLCQREEVDLVIPTRDEELPVFAKHRESLEEVGTRVMVPSMEVVEIAQDKRRFAEFASANGCATPALLSTPDPEAYPVFVRPRRGKGSRQTRVAHSSSELQLALAALGGEAVVQEYVDAPEFTIDLFADFDGRVISVVPRQRLVIFGGESFVGRTTKNPVIRDQAMGLAEKLGLIGHNTIQCFLRSEEVLFIEVNPRFGGGAHLGFAAGAPTPHFLLRLLRGERLEPRLDDWKDGLHMLRYTEDLFLEQDALARRESEA